MRSLLFINCGGYLDLTTMWFYTQRDSVKAYLIDSHRPYNHKNVNEEGSKIFVIHDGCKSFDECPTAEEDRIYQQILDAEDPDASEEDEYDSEYSDL